MVAKLKVIKYGDNIDTDAIIAARYLNTTDEHEIAVHCMEDIDPDFAEKAADGCVIIAGRNFGCGSSREHAPIALMAAGVKYVIAESFARIFYRNAVNIGLPIIECPEAAKEIRDGSRIEVDTVKGIITHGKKTYKTMPFPDFLNKVIESGGLMNALKAGKIK